MHVEDESGTFDSHGIKIKFPYKNPYEAQKALVNASIMAFSQGKNAILESPTGTGKTVALLTAALSYQEQDKQLSKIYYSTRTHTQLNQVVQEYKNVLYTRKMAILGSRKRLCIEPTIKQMENLDYECLKGSCKYGKSNPIPQIFQQGGELHKFDIEEYIS